MSGSITRPGLPYRPCVGLMLVNEAGRAFVGRRVRSAGPEHVDDTHSWQMPQGGIDPGEDPYRAALRELYEETNVRSVSFLGEAADWFSYDLPDAITKRAWKGRYRGQTQKWFLLRFTGDEREVDVLRPANGRHKAEFDAWRWADLDELAGLIIPFKRPVYEQVVAAFRPVLAASASLA